ncbi:MAG: aryl-sulfate sulfotransferase [Peptococcaceae bacterium]
MKRKACVATMLTIILFMLFASIAWGAASDFSNDDRLVNQAQIERDILAEFEGRDYDLDNPLVKINPYGWSPLTALIMFDTPQPARIELTVKGKNSHSTISHNFKTFTKHHEIPVYGLYAGKNNEVKLKIDYKKGETITKRFIIETSPLPSDFPNVDVLKAVPGQVEDGLTFMVGSFAEVNRPFAVDINGDIRWYLDDKNAGVVGPIRRLANGHIQLVSEKLEKSPYYHASFYEMDLMGKIYTEFLRTGIHHEVREMPNGDFIVVTEKAGRDTTEDYIVILDRETGLVKDRIDCREIFNICPDPQKPSSDPTYGDDTHDWLHINAVWYVEEDNSILVSARHQDVVFKVDLDTKEVLWILSDPNDYWPENLIEKILTPVGKNFEYQYGQHAVMKLPNGDIFLYDNGNYRSKDPATALEAKDNYSRGVIYRVNENDLTVKQIWQYGKERGSSLFTSYIGDVDYFGGKHYLINFGGIAFNNDGSIANSPWPLVAGEGYGIAHIIEINKDKVIFEIEVNGITAANYYRVERMKAYKDEQEYQLGREGVQKGELVAEE